MNHSGELKPRIETCTLEARKEHAYAVAGLQAELDEGFCGGFDVVEVLGSERVFSDGRAPAHTSSSAISHRA